MSEKPWKVQCMAALARYYEAQAVVEELDADLAKLGLESGQYDVSNRAARQCACGQWVTYFAWSKPTGVAVCGPCALAVEQAIKGDEREEKGLPREEPPEVLP